MKRQACIAGISPACNHILVPVIPAGDGKHLYAIEDLYGASPASGSVGSLSRPTAACTGTKAMAAARMSAETHSMGRAQKHW